MKMTEEEYQRLLKLATPSQAEKLKLYYKHQSNAKAARKLGVNESSVRKAIKHVRVKDARTQLLNGENTDEVEELYPIKAVSQYYDAEGNPTSKWIKRDIAKDQQLKALSEAIDNICERVEGAYKPKEFKVKPQKMKDLLPLYISNDVHLGALSWKAETRDRDWTLASSIATFRAAIDDLVDRAPVTKECVVADLGDLIEMDDFKNATPGHGHTLDVSARYSEVLEVANDMMAYFVEKALEKHEIVYFYNVSGNHDKTSGLAIRSFMRAYFKDEPRVVVDTSPAFQKYHRFGSTLLGFAHGDGLKMQKAGEVMALHNQEIWSETVDRFYHFGHNHKDSVVEGILCKSESHRNIAPLNAWAAHAGFGRQTGTMKCIMYSKHTGEETRITHKVREVIEDE
jgi:hypothetical protein